MLTAHVLSSTIVLTICSLKSFYSYKKLMPATIHVKTSDEKVLWLDALSNITIGLCQGSNQWFCVY